MHKYNLIQRFFHDLVFKKKIINKSLFEIEKKIYLKNKNINKDKHIFITGLPRSGSTGLLNFLYSSNEYASLKYRNMPFILSPNISKLISGKNILKSERLHGDGIFYDLDSPEAFDEVFFGYDENFVNKELLNYIKLILISENKQKYLSKNNLNYKRIDLISSIFPNSIFLILVRKPLQHSYSLLNQHFNFNKLQKNDDFIKRYMNYLGHNEFGLTHKPWNKSINFKDANSINYWLEQWVLFYEDVYNKYLDSNNCNFVIYEKLTNSYYLKKLLKKINLNNFHNADPEFFKNSNKNIVDVKIDSFLFERASIIYEKFSNLV